MKRTLTFGIVILSLHASLAHAAPPCFTLAPGSPTLTAIGAGPADVLVPAAPLAPGPTVPPVIAIPASALGLGPGDVLSSVASLLPETPAPGMRIYFSVDAASAGVPFAAPPANVSCEAAGGQAQADVFAAQPLGPPLAHTNVLALDGNGAADSPCGPPAVPGLGLQEPPDDVTSLTLCDGMFDGTDLLNTMFFTLAPGSPTLTALGATAADILARDPGMSPPYVAFYGSIRGLRPGDVIDGLNGRIDPSIPPTIIVSLAPGSPSLAACGFSAADTLVASLDTGPCAVASGGPALHLSTSAAALGLAASDNVDGFITVFDADGDFVFDPQDNCPSTFNVDQKDTDGDTIGDACDPVPGKAVGVKKLVIKDPSPNRTKRQIQLQSKDPGLLLSETDDPSVHGASVQLYSATDNICLLIPPGAGWKGTTKKWQWKDPITKKRSVQIGNGALKVKIQTGITYSLDNEPHQNFVNAQVQFGTGTRYCMKCPGNVKDVGGIELKSVFSAKDCVAADCDPDLAPCHQTECGTVALRIGVPDPSDALGANGNGDGQFGTPLGLAFGPTGDLFVADQGTPNHDRVQRFTTTGAFVSKFGSSGQSDGQFDGPQWIAVDGNGNVFVTDQANSVQKFSSSGAFLTKWGGPYGGIFFGSADGEFHLPQGIAVDASGNVFVADFGNHRIQKFTNDGIFIDKWGVLGSGDGEFVDPVGVAVDASGNVYVTDVGNHNVQKFTNSGTFVSKFGSPGDGNGQFGTTAPWAIAIGPNGDIFAGETVVNVRVQHFDSAGNFIGKWGREGRAEGWFAGAPHGIAVDGAGNVYVSDDARVQKFLCP